ncbi:MAG: Ni/Fe-hydrogenase, b-type cytochrome subunit [Desulfocapsa sp.]|nr:Ni/Fe-hydrogenase, b-type cytochrome subunit [Desulfocapsa sp.]
MSYEIKNVWSVLLRLFHWSLVLSIVTLVVTGLYINTPWTNTTLEGSVSFPMATMRYIHFLAGYLFAAAVMVRLFLYIFGNRQERIFDILPVTPRNFKSLTTTLGYYSYLSDKHDERLGHNVLAGIVYIVTFVAALFQLSSGFYMLYPEAAFWQGLGGSIFGTQQEGRFLHHLLMWYFILFAFVHVYLVVWNDLKSPEGLVSSMFNGKKFKHKNV